MHTDGLECTCIQIHTQTGAHAHTHTPVHTRAHTHTHTHTCTHTHTHTHTPLLPLIITAPRLHPYCRNMETTTNPLTDSKEDARLHSCQSAAPYVIGHH